MQVNKHKRACPTFVDVYAVKPLSIPIQIKFYSDKILLGMC
jgi:hypothetical protein